MAENEVGELDRSQIIWEVLGHSKDSGYYTEYADNSFEGF